MENFKDNIKQWVELDNASNRYKIKMDELKKKKEEFDMERNKVGDNILSFMENNKLEDNEIIISDGKIKYQQSKSSTSISQKFIIERLKEYFKDEEKAKEVTQFIYSGREVSYTPVLKRTRAKIKSFE
mgnify:FL=1|tara:strand:- start:578 stop:961 length:384 start_codon:yes stop_codon:yes gene_type:complete